jgi:hydroxyethylthiazole kinase-like uncharacterized protein yjeF
MKVVTPLQMQKIDRETIFKYGIASIKLMETAGKKVSEVAMKMAKPRSSISIFCGGGNNGGDGLVAARYLAKKNYKVKVFFFSSKLSKDAQINFELAKKIGTPCLFIDNKRALTQQKKTIFSTDLIIDALIGTGLKGEVKGFLKEVISFMNNTNLPILSIDCPSGLSYGVDLNSDNCIKAKATVTLALPKKDLVVYPGAKFVGSLYIADIGIPKKLLTQKSLKTSLIDRNLVFPLLALPRETDAHKGDFGHVFIVAGSRNTPGASVLSTRGVLRSGAGLVTLGVPKNIHSIVSKKLTESMFLPLLDTIEGSLSLKAEQEILKFVSEKADIVAVGPGVSLNKETGTLIRNILMKMKKPVVLDADGITHLAADINILKKRKFPTIITPHPGEMARQINLTPKEINKKRVELVRKLSTEYKIYTVLKGASTVIGSPSGEIFINTTGNPAMSSGGMGDVLTGLIAGYLAQKFSPLQACIIGVYIHGLTGDYLKEEMGERGILAGDLADAIPLISKKFIKKELTDKFFLI